MTSRQITSCEEALRLLAAHLDGELDDATHTEVERHVEICRSCYSRAEFERRLRQQLRGLAHEPVDASLSRRIRHLIGAFATSPADGVHPRQRS